MPRKKETLTLSVPPGTRERLDLIADRLGFHWGKSPSPSALVTAIAEGQLKVDAKEVIRAPQVAALRQAIADLVDAGHIEQAEIVITLLLEHGDLETPLRQELLRQVSKPSTGFRGKIDEFRRNSQPFHLLYKLPKGESQEFTASYAEITPYEKRLYLQIWTAELPKDAESEIPELKHNRCLRLDRIEGVVPVSGAWRGYFDSINVQIRLLGGLARAYEAKENDIEDDGGHEERNVTRRVINLFWFIREVRCYGSDCIVIRPEAVRERVADDFAKALSHYRKT